MENKEFALIFTVPLVLVNIHTKVFPIKASDTFASSCEGTGAFINNSKIVI